MKTNIGEGALYQGGYDGIDNTTVLTDQIAESCEESAYGSAKKANQI